MKVKNKMNTIKLIGVSESMAREMKNCPVCTSKKELNTVVCWHCWKNKPKHSALATSGFKYYDGTLEEFINLANIPF